MHTLTGHSDGVQSVTFSPNGKIVASGSYDNTVKLWNVANGRELRTLTGHCAEVEAVAFSPDGKALACGSQDNTVRLWNVASRTRVRTLKGHSGPVMSVSFSPDGKTLASGGGDWKGGEVMLWDVESGRELHTLTGHSNGVGWINFSPDGKTLSSECEDQAAKFWDVATGKELAPGRLHPLPSKGRGWSRHNGVLAHRDGPWIRLVNTFNWNDWVRLVALGEHDWVAVDAHGRFDASPGGMKRMHYMVGPKLMEVTQFKARYYDAGLVSKRLGFRKDSLRPLSAHTGQRSSFRRVTDSTLVP